MFLGSVVAIFVVGSGQVRISVTFAFTGSLFQQTVTVSLIRTSFTKIILHKKKQSFYFMI